MLERAESTQTQPGVGTESDLRLGEAVTGAQAEENNTEGIKIEEYDMHVCIQITRSGQDRDTELDIRSTSPCS